MMYWRRVGKFDGNACALADRHYSRQKIGTRQFMPPGETIVLLTDDNAAVFGWSRQRRPLDGRTGWKCTLFRNESLVYLSSELILYAEDALGEDRGSVLTTYVDDSRVRSANPGYCFKCAGYVVVGRSKRRGRLILQKTL